jgi:hypothetical protein
LAFGFVISRIVNDQTILLTVFVFALGYHYRHAWLPFNFIPITGAIKHLFMYRYEVQFALSLFGERLSAQSDFSH